MNNGCLVISLDFELVWGIIEKTNVDNYCNTHIKNVPLVVDRMLDLFDRYKVRATFATVGFLMCHDKDEIIKNSPSLKPSYRNTILSPYNGYIDAISNNDYRFFAPDIIDRLKTNNNIEIGTHTFCHYYCLEEGQTEAEFEQDLIAAIAIAKKNDIRLKSIVFPRNNVNQNYLRICYKHGITSYRGNATKFFKKPNNRFQLIRNRVGRLMDSYLPLNSHSSYSLSSLKQAAGYPLNIPASRFFRPYSKKGAIFEPLRLFRIKQEIRSAAKNGELYHLWWHPHNFGGNMEENLKNLETVLKFYAGCRDKYGMKSYTMNEVAKLINQGNE